MIHLILAVDESSSAYKTGQIVGGVIAGLLIAFVVYKTLRRK